MLHRVESAPSYLQVLVEVGIESQMSSESNPQVDDVGLHLSSLSIHMEFFVYSSVTLLERGDDGLGFRWIHLDLDVLQFLSDVQQDCQG